MYFLPLIFYRIYMYKLVLHHLTGSIMQEMVDGQGFKSQPSQACIFSQVLRGTYREFNVYNVYWVGQNPNLYSLEQFWLLGCSLLKFHAQPKFLVDSFSSASFQMAYLKFSFQISFIGIFFNFMLNFLFRNFFLAILMLNLR